MAKHDSTQSTSTLPPSLPEPMALNEFTRSLNGRLHDIDNEFYRLLCAYQFYGEAMMALMEQPEPGPRSEKWHYGLSVWNDWLEANGESITERLKEASVWATKARIKIS